MSSKHGRGIEQRNGCIFAIVGIRKCVCKEARHPQPNATLNEFIPVKLKSKKAWNKLVAAAVANINQITT